MGMWGKLGELADGSVFFLLIRIGFFTIVVSAIHVIQRAILYADGQIFVLQNSNHTHENRYSFLYPTGVVLLNKGSTQNTLWDVACGLCNWHSIILIIMSAIVAV